MSDEVRQIAGATVYVCAAEGPKLDSERAATDIIGDSYASRPALVAIPVERLGADFLALSNRIAGNVIQKFVNYGVAVAFVGDVSDAIAQSTALRDFVRESNRGRHVWFVADMAELEAKLAG
ncbi:MAG: DUF4180 domain-containing protein [Phenylobacterium sp.]|uniref:DUF4180 domain-containing protein n=1 Tax=Phenylobacterium sp. TaxID=1871053 RepID=UPI001A5E90E4|nr:DUF4180 domain-containing protein [Phenylobacterium sp.]MBL8555997.1 DUF4180 domain-containing protein [Phenylobacterium sp.]